VITAEMRRNGCGKNLLADEIPAEDSDENWVRRFQFGLNSGLRDAKSEQLLLLADYNALF
jgi:hypothetical protein